jgi:hypothetical protein
MASEFTIDNSGYERDGAEPSPSRRRLAAAIVVAGCTSVLGMAAWMTPSPNGVGTHEQLSLPPCGWITLMDMPCMTCGMTTSFAHAARGNLIASFLAQPMGFLLAITMAMSLVIAMHVAITGSNIAAMLLPMWRPRTLWLVAGIALVAWVYKIIVHKGILL